MDEMNSGANATPDYVEPPATIYQQVCDAIAGNYAGTRTWMNIFDGASQDDINQFYVDCGSQDEFNRINAVAMENSFTIPPYTGA